MPHTDFGVWLQQQLDERLMRPTHLAQRLKAKPELVEGWLTGEAQPIPYRCRHLAVILGLTENEVLHAAGY